MQLKPRSDAASSVATGTTRTFAAALIVASVALPMPALAADISDLSALRQSDQEQKYYRTNGRVENGRE